MFAHTGKTPAVLIKEFRKTSDKPVLKAAYVEGCVYVGDNQLDTLCNIKSREELIGDIIAPAAISCEECYLCIAV